MKGASKVIMGFTVVMVVGVGFVLTVVLVLLAELYCNLILRRRQQRQQLVVSSPDTTPITTASTTIPSSPPSNLHHSSPSPTPALGVLQAPRSFLFPAVKEAKRLINSRRTTNNNNHNHRESHHQLHHVLELYDNSSKASPQQIGLVGTPPPPSSYLSSPQEIREISAVVHHHHHHNQNQNQISPAHKETPNNIPEHFIYISNPIYVNKGADHDNSGSDTPFETPDSSPSRLQSGDMSSSDDDEIAKPSTTTPPVGNTTPPLLPMKKLPAEASSVSLRDACRSLGTNSGSTDSNSNKGLLSSSSSRDGSPSTSHSW